MTSTTEICCVSHLTARRRKNSTQATTNPRLSEQLRHHDEIIGSSLKRVKEKRLITQAIQLFLTAHGSLSNQVTEVRHSPYWLSLKLFNIQLFPRLDIAVLLNLVICDSRHSTSIQYKLKERSLPPRPLTLLSSHCYPYLVPGRPALLLHSLTVHLHWLLGNEILL